MSRDDFVSILTDLRFDDAETRRERMLRDNMAAIRELWTHFNENLLKHFIPSVDLTIDEQLILFRGRCKFKIYNKSKPGTLSLFTQVCLSTNLYF